MMIFNVRNQNISRIDNFSPTEKSENYLEAQFNFKTDDWQGVTKTAVFENAKAKVIKDVILVNDKCLVPWEVLDGNSAIKVSVYGVSLSEKITTDIAEFKLNSTLHGGSATTEPTPDVYQQIINMIENIEAGDVPEEQITKAVDKYLAEHPVDTLTKEDVQNIVSTYVTEHKEELKGEKGDKGDPGTPGNDGMDGADGEDGFSPTIEENADNTDDVYKLTITTKDGTFTTPNLKGEAGTGESSDDESTQYANDTSFIYPLYHDIYVIPDKHNTGADDSTCNLTVEADVVTDYGVKFRSDDGTSIKIDFNKAPNKTIEGEIVIENVDFTSYTTGSGFMNTYGYTGNGVVIKYINCKFINFVDASHTTELIKAEFTNCSFTRYTGSYAVFNNCYFGGGDLNGDPMNPVTNCTFNNCYCSDIVQKTEEAGTNHMDGMQSTECKNLYFNNCRWEVPDINYSVKAGGMNVAIYIQPSDTAENVIFDHCYINGGGYYTLSCADNDISVLNNVKFIEPFIGYCYKASNPLYDSVTKEVLVNPSLHDSLYVSSVWKDDDGYLRFMTSNDTGVDRELKVVTNLGEFIFEIPRTYKATEYDEDTKTFDDLPIDVENVIEQTGIDYVIFYEGSRQLRFVNYSIYRIRKND